jgi:hypothetical protein
MLLRAMTTRDDETRRIVETYFRAWTSNNVDEAYSVLAADL